MKECCLLISLLANYFISFAQLSNCTGGNFVPAMIDSFYFENDTNAYGRLVIDTTFPGNVWQIGAVQKAGFANALSGTHALQTDTLNAYPTNNESAVMLYVDSNTLWFGSPDFSLSFWHYYDTDTLTDSCILQFTVDSGKTWQNYAPGFWGGMIYYSGSLNNYDSTWGSADTLLWSGKSNGWVKESICVLYYALKGMPLPKIYGFRFLFHSDSVQTNKPGWMIDNVTLRYPQVTGSDIKHVSQGKNLLYPNPSATGIFNVDYPHSYVNGEIELYNNYGQKVRQERLTKTFNITSLPKGFYHYRIIFEDTKQAFTGTVIYD